VGFPTGHVSFFARADPEAPADYNSAFPAGGTVAASWDRQVWYDRGHAMGEEHAYKGVDVVLGPVVGPLGRSPEGGRNWEGFSPDPFLSGQAVYHTVKGVQSAGVVACTSAPTDGAVLTLAGTKHFIGNEQEHFRQTLSSNIDDVTLHELYLWYAAPRSRNR
jgi:beta-glucosidase